MSDRITMAGYSYSHDEIERAAVWRAAHPGATTAQSAAALGSGSVQRTHYLLKLARAHLDEQAGAPLVAHDELLARLGPRSWTGSYETPAAVARARAEALFGEAL